MISQALSASCQQISGKSEASKDFQCHPYVTLDAMGLGRKPIKPSMLCWLFNTSNKLRLLSNWHKLPKNNFHYLMQGDRSLTLWNVPTNFTRQALALNSLSHVTLSSLSTSPAELLQGFVSRWGSGSPGPRWFTPLAAVCWGLAPSSSRYAVCCILLSVCSYIWRICPCVRT